MKRDEAALQFRLYFARRTHTSPGTHVRLLLEHKRACCFSSCLRRAIHAVVSHFSNISLTKGPQHTLLLCHPTSRTSTEYKADAMENFPSATHEITKTCTHSILPTAITVHGDSHPIAIAKGISAALEELECASLGHGQEPSVVHSITTSYWDPYVPSIKE